MKLRNLSIPSATLYKLGMYVVLFLAWTGGVYGYAMYRCNIAHEREKTELAKQETVDTINEVNERLPQVQIREVESAKQRARIAQLEGQLNEALQNRQDNPACALSDAEFGAVNGLLRATQQ